MRRSGRAWMVALALGSTALTADLAAPGAAETASVTIESHRRQGWSGDGSGGGDHRPAWRHDGHGRPGQGGHPPSWHQPWTGHRPGWYWGWGPGWYRPTPVWVAPHWVWVGYGWVLAPGYWR